MQWEQPTRSLVRWALGALLCAAGALAFVLLTQADRAGAAELPTDPVATAGASLLEPVVAPIAPTVAGDVDTALGTASDARHDLGEAVGSVVGIVTGSLPGDPLDLGTVPVVGDLLPLPDVPLPDPGTVPLPVALPEGPGPAGPGGEPGDAAPATAAADTARSAPVTARDRRDAVDSPGIPSTLTPTPGSAPTGLPASGPQPLLAPLGVLASVAGGGTGTGLILLAVLGALVWARDRGPGRRLAALALHPVGGVVTPFERPG